MWATHIDDKLDGDIPGYRVHPEPPDEGRGD